LAQQPLSAIRFPPPKRRGDPDRRAGVQLHRNAVHRLPLGGGSFADPQDEPVLEVPGDVARARKGEVEEDEARLAGFERPGRPLGPGDQQQRHDFGAAVGSQHARG